MSDQIERRIYVETPLFSGWAKVAGYVPCAFYPIEIILENGDEDGHRHKRICKDDIVKTEE